MKESSNGSQKYDVEGRKTRHRRRRKMEVPGGGGKIGGIIGTELQWRVCMLPTNYGE